jgi:uncharacterized protein (TIGR00369 family)
VSTHRHVPNPYVGHDGYHCFGCDPDNRAGLRLTFTVEDDTVVSLWEPRAELEGYPGVIHGGIQATLADEIGGWYLHAIKGTAGMTRELQISYHRPALSSDGPFRLEARLVEEAGRDALIEVTLSGASGVVFSTARCRYVVFSEELARKKLSFPGAAAFRPAE